MYQRIITGIFLGICTGMDIKWKYIHKRIVFLYLMLVLSGHLYTGSQMLLGADTDGAVKLLIKMGAGMLPGGFFFLVSWGSRQELGYGDSVIITVCGISLGAQRCLWIVFTALLWAALYGAVLFIFKKYGRKKEIPFVPFLLLGYVIQGMGAG